MALILPSGFVVLIWLITYSLGNFMRNKKGQFQITHGSSGMNEYNIWGNIIYRCNNKLCFHFPSYGGRGISVCDRWLKFENFISDMGKRPTANHSLDRIDNNGNYDPDNCRWATKKQQSRNRRNSRIVFIDGLKLQVDDYCEKYGLSKAAIKNRFRRNWSNDKIINTPVRGSNISHS